jgi:hypothetical protein
MLEAIAVQTIVAFIAGVCLGGLVAMGYFLRH